MHACERDACNVCSLMFACMHALHCDVSMHACMHLMYYVARQCGAMYVCMRCRSVIHSMYVGMRVCVHVCINAMYAMKFYVLSLMHVVHLCDVCLHARDVCINALYRNAMYRVDA